MQFVGTTTQLADAMSLDRTKVYGLVTFLESIGQATVTGIDRGGRKAGKGANVYAIEFPITIDGPADGLKSPTGFPVVPGTPLVPRDNPGRSTFDPEITEYLPASPESGPIPAEYLGCPVIDPYPAMVESLDPASLGSQDSTTATSEPVAVPLHQCGIVRAEDVPAATIGVVHPEEIPDTSAEFVAADDEDFDF